MGGNPKGMNWGCYTALHSRTLWHWIVYTMLLPKIACRFWETSEVDRRVAWYEVSERSHAALSTLSSEVTGLSAPYLDLPWKRNERQPLRAVIACSEIFLSLQIKLGEYAVWELSRPTELNSTLHDIVSSCTAPPIHHPFLPLQFQARTAVLRALDHVCSTVKRINTSLVIGDDCERLVRAVVFCVLWTFCKYAFPFKELSDNRHLRSSAENHSLTRASLATHFCTAMNAVRTWRIFFLRALGRNQGP